MKTQRVIFIVLIFIATVQIASYYPQLPEKVASHFNGAGNPNGCSSKKEFISIYVMVIAVMLLIYLVLPALFRYIPKSLISLPKKDYWLAPERREKTFTFIAGQMLCFGNATFILLIATFQLAIEANLSDTRHFSSNTMWILLIGYFFFVILWSVRFISKFVRAGKQ
jgi:uncharacterized membrane protein